ncbi:hypothetical protein PHMEG_0004627 [Phytophthora megakarya]|uniref:Peptidase A2 domain-containing protein n=1 Tax=Phytophthora megakarya TaxID=4795 RepID=A0A225WV21_9STRA|nr:hypothetical protein PHMEG_0004627 [Phytophthora megakarya]
MGREQKNEYVTYELVITPATVTAPAETAKVKIKRFRGESARDWLNLARKKQWTDEQKAPKPVASIEGDLEADVEGTAQDAVAGNKSFEQFFTDVGLLSVPHDFSDDLDNEVWRMAKRLDESVLKVSHRVKENNRMFTELSQDAEEIPEVQSCRYFKRGMPRAWQEKLAASGAILERFSELLLYFTRIEKAERQPAARDKNKSYKNQRKEKNQPHTAKKEKWCTFHKASSHNTNDCYTLKKKVAEEHKHVKILPQVKRKKTKQYSLIYKKSGAESESDKSSDEEMEFVDHGQEGKEKFKSAPLRITVWLRRGGDTFKALLDSGASKSIINKETLASNVKAGRRFIPASPTVFDTRNGSVTSNGTIVAQFLFPDLKTSTIITHRVEVINDSRDTMIIIRDIMNELGLILNFKDKSNRKTFFLIVCMVKWQPTILALLIKHQTLYDGHLGRLWFNDYDIPLSPVFKLMHVKPYPIARSLEGKAKTKIQQLVNADVLEQIYDSEMASSAFFLTNPDGSLRLLVDFRSLKCICDRARTPCREKGNTDASSQGKMHFHLRRQFRLLRTTFDKGKSPTHRIRFAFWKY